MRLLADIGGTRRCWVFLIAIFVFSTTLSVAAQEDSKKAAEQANPAQTDAQTAPGANAKSSGSDSDMRFGVGDLMEVSVYGVPELTTKARISSSGDIYFPLIDYVHVEGLTPEQAQGVIEKRLADGGFVNNPHVQIFVNEYASQSVTVLGEVTRPGPYSILGERRLYDVISSAG